METAEQLWYSYACFCHFLSTLTEWEGGGGGGVLMYAKAL